MDMIWADIKSAPKDGKPFLAWYESEFGPSFGTMKWEPNPKGDGGKYLSMTMGTQTKYATHWLEIHKPREWSDVSKYRSRIFDSQIENVEKQEKK